MVNKQTKNYNWTYDGSLHWIPSCSCFLESIADFSASWEQKYSLKWWWCIRRMMYLKALSASLIFFVPSVELVFHLEHKLCWNWFAVESLKQFSLKMNYSEMSDWRVQKLMFLILEVFDFVCVCVCKDRKFFRSFVEVLWLHIREKLPWASLMELWNVHICVSPDANSSI